MDAGSVGILNYATLPISIYDGAPTSCLGEISAREILTSQLSLYIGLTEIIGLCIATRAMCDWPTRVLKRVDRFDNGLTDVETVSGWESGGKSGKKSTEPDSNQRPMDAHTPLQSTALPTELSVAPTTKHSEMFLINVTYPRLPNNETVVPPTGTAFPGP